jgi:hypothetical protein
MSIASKRLLDLCCEGGISRMKPVQWLSILAGVVLLITLAVWTARGASAGRNAAAAIVQAQRDISAVQEAHVEVDPAALRAAEADLLTTTTAFNRAKYTTASAFVQHASQAAQERLAGLRSADSR